MSDYLEFLKENNIYDCEENHLAELQLWIIDEIVRLRAENEKLTRSREGWEAHAKTYAKNAEYWISRTESAEEERDRLRDALTPSAETKAAYIGEFHFVILDLDEDENEVTRRIPVPWTTVKEIMAAIRARAALGDEP
jgi:hypothetical protein